MFHPKVLSFEDAVEKKRLRAADSVMSTAKILLPFAVQKHIESKTNLSFQDSRTKLVYVDLKASRAEKYAVVYDNGEFEESQFFTFTELNLPFEFSRSLQPSTPFTTRDNWRAAIPVFFERLILQSFARSLF